MPSHDTNVRLRHMLDAAREAAQMVQGKTRGKIWIRTARSTFRWCGCWRSSAKQRAVSRLVSAYNTLAFRRQVQIVGLRNRLIHGYDNVDFDILWEIVTQDLPPLIAELEKIFSATP